MAKSFGPGTQKREPGKPSPKRPGRHDNTGPFQPGPKKSDVGGRHTEEKCGEFFPSDERGTGKG